MRYLKSWKQDITPPSKDLVILFLADAIKSPIWGKYCTKINCSPYKSSKKKNT